MALLFARQPILSESQELYGYELLYREEGSNAYNGKDGDMASSSVMAAGFLSMGVDEITGGKRAFINFTEKMLLHHVATLFPKEQIVVEILESVEPNKEVLSACRSLKQRGYTLALDDFVFRPGYENLVKLANIIKVDFFLTRSEEERKEIIKSFGNEKILFLAEKVETQEDYLMALRCGYKLFQGYYFSKPVISSIRGLPQSAMNHLLLMKAFAKEEAQFDDILPIIEKDVAFSYEILRIANTAYYYRGERISSVRRAAVLLGMEELRKWAYITILRKIADKGQDALVNICAQRAKCLELVSKRTQAAQWSNELFTAGILSMLDTMMGCPMEEIMKELPLCCETRDLLLGSYDDSAMSLCYLLVLAYEKGQWDSFLKLADKLSLSQEIVTKAYLEAIVWINGINTR